MSNPRDTEDFWRTPMGTIVVLVLGYCIFETIHFHANPYEIVHRASGDTVCNFVGTALTCSNEGIYCEGNERALLCRIGY